MILSCGGAILDIVGVISSVLGLSPLDAIGLPQV